MPNTNLPVVQKVATVRTLDAETMSFADMLAMGTALCTTGFMPVHIKTAAQAAAIILTGRELGMQPMRALRSLNMVKGKVTENADSQLARFKTDGGRSTFRELTHDRAVLHLVHPNGDEHTEEFTMRDATAAGLSGGGSMYEKHAKAMLRSRVITAGLKSVGWEGGAGTYDPDELPPAASHSGTLQNREMRNGEPLGRAEAMRELEARIDAREDEVFGAVVEEAEVVHEAEDDLREMNADEEAHFQREVFDGGFSPDDALTFGKHRGRTMREIFTDDAKYLGWYYRTEKEKVEKSDKYAKSPAWMQSYRTWLKSMSPQPSSADATPAPSPSEQSAEEERALREEADKVPF